MVKAHQNLCTGQATNFASAVVFSLDKTAMAFGTRTSLLRLRSTTLLPSLQRALQLRFALRPNQARASE